MSDNYLSDKTLVMLVGPTAVGKSTIMHEVTKLDTEFTYAKTFTTRPKREGETTTYRHLTTEQAEAIRAHAFTYLEHPTTGVIYGTDAKTYQSKYTLLDTLANTVAAYRKLPFEKTIIISVTCDSHEWEERLEQRFPTSSDERTKRLREAKQSIEWSLAQTDDHYWLVNHDGNITTMAESVLQIAHGQDQPTKDAPPEARMMLKTVERLLSYE